MSVTISSFRATFPSFADDAKFPDMMVQFWLDLAVKRHNADRWGDLLDSGIQLYIAHELSVEAASASASAGGATPGQVAGAITSRSVGGVSYSRESASAYFEKDAGYMNLSAFGLRWQNLARLVGAGPLQVGSPGFMDNQSAQPWMGP